MAPTVKRHDGAIVYDFLLVPPPVNRVDGARASEEESGEEGTNVT